MQKSEKSVLHSARRELYFARRKETEMNAKLTVSRIHTAQTSARVPFETTHIEFITPTGETVIWVGEKARLAVFRLHLDVGDTVNARFSNGVANHIRVLEIAK